MRHFVSFRKATIDDLPLLKYWDTKQHVIDCDPDSDWNWEEELKKDPPWRQQFVAEVQKRPLGFVQIIDAHEEETHYWGDVEPHTMAIDIWIGEEEDLNKGYGSTMMRNALDLCFMNPLVNKVLIDPLKTNTKAHRFYERLGFKFLEERKFGDSDSFVYIMTRDSWIWFGTP